MRREWILMAAGLLLASASVATAQDQSCTYEGERYGEGTTVCQAGLQQTCENGTWQSLDGIRCGRNEDQEVEPSGNLEIDPQGGFERE